MRITHTCMCHPELRNEIPKSFFHKERYGNATRAPKKNIADQTFTVTFYPKTIPIEKHVQAMSKSDYGAPWPVSQPDTSCSSCCFSVFWKRTVKSEIDKSHTITATHKLNSGILRIGRFMHRWRTDSLDSQITLQNLLVYLHWSLLCWLRGVLCVYRPSANLANVWRPLISLPTWL